MSAEKNADPGDQDHFNRLNTAVALAQQAELKLASALQHVRKVYPHDEWLIGVLSRLSDMLDELPLEAAKARDSSPDASPPMPDDDSEFRAVDPSGDWKEIIVAVPDELDGLVVEIDGPGPVRARVGLYREEAERLTGWLLHHVGAFSLHLEAGEPPRTAPAASASPAFPRPSGPRT